MTEGSGGGGSGGADRPMWGPGSNASDRQPDGEAPAPPPSGPPPSAPMWGKGAAPPPAAPPPATPPSAPMWGEGAPPPATPPPSAPPAGPMWGQGSPPPQPVAQPPATAGQPGGPAPGAWGPGGPPPPVKPGGIPGCVKALIIVGVLLIIALVVFVFAAGAFVNSLIPGGLGALDNNGGDIDEECAFLSDDEARAVLGGNADAIEFSGFYEATLGLVIDTRVLATAEDCWVTDGERAYIARVARYDGADAAAVFTAEREAAQPVTEDQGGGISVTRDGYDAGDAPGIGDEAFCTGISSAIMAGVLVRQGDTLVYASVGPPSEGASVPDMQPDDGGVIASPSLCALAQEVARAALN